MALSENQRGQLQVFFNQSHFEEEGAVITDLDGTAIHEYQGKYSVPQSVELGLKKIHDLGRPVVINTLRFPLSVMRTFGREWYSISNSPVPTVLMNGSQLGYMIETKEGVLSYDEIAAFPLDEKEIDDVLKVVQELVSANLLDLLVFHYPRDWTQGEIIWTPVREKVDAVANKYKSAETVYSSSVAELEEKLKMQEICMIFLLIEAPEDKLMAYQHTKRSNFFTHEGVDKLFGAEYIASHLGFKMKHSLGAGDSEMDSFLKGVGQAVHVGNPYLSYEGLLPPIKVAGSSELGELFFHLAAMQRTVLK